MAARKELGVRTIFNLLGPLTNPARAVNQVMGVYDSELIEPLVEVLRSLGGRNIMVVAAEDGLDELSCSAVTHVGELRDGEVFRYNVTPEDFGIKRRKDYVELQVSSPEESLKLLKKSLNLCT
jgi:anthranilate phosphoribosyltransferase